MPTLIELGAALHHGRPPGAAVPLSDTSGQPGSDTVLAAFRRAFAADAGAMVALPGGLWANEVPEDVELPYGFVELLDSRFLWTTEEFHLEFARVRVHAYAAGGENCEAATRSVRRLYDWADLEFDPQGTSSTVQVMPTDYCVQSEFARLRTGEIVYQGTAEYEVMVNRNSLRS